MLVEMSQMRTSTADTEGTRKSPAVQVPSGAPHLSRSSYHHELLLLVIVSGKTFGVGFAEAQHDPVTQDILNLVRCYACA